ncbi:hypothetical protein Dimus_001492, partial [Dionaea muscipula]
MPARSRLGQHAFGSAEQPLARGFSGSSLLTTALLYTLSWPSLAARAGCVCWPPMGAAGCAGWLPSSAAGHRWWWVDSSARSLGWKSTLVNVSAYVSAICREEVTELIHERGRSRVTEVVVTEIAEIVVMTRIITTAHVPKRHRGGRRKSAIVLPGVKRGVPRAEALPFASQTLPTAVTSHSCLVGVLQVGLVPREARHTQRR